MGARGLAPRSTSSRSPAMSLHRGSRHGVHEHSTRDEGIAGEPEDRHHRLRAVARWRHGLARDTGGAIVFHIAEHHAGLFPDDADARARAITWMFAALNTVEPPILELVIAKFAEGDMPWAEERLPLVKDRIRDRLVQLSARLGDADWLDGAFSAGDLMMVSVLLRLRPSGLLDEFPKLAAYVARGEARPAYKRAFAAQWAINAGDPQAG